MLLAIAILIAVACCVREHWTRLSNDDPEWDPLLRKWFIQGVAVPAAAWAIVNLGLSDRFPALVPNIVVAQAANKVWLNFLACGAGVMWFQWGCPLDYENLYDGFAFGGGGSRRERTDKFAAEVQEDAVA